MTRYARLDLDDGRRVYAELADVGAWVLDDAPWLGGKRTDERVDAWARFAVPVEPSKIVCIGRNYAAHAAELGNEVPAEPLLFLKPPSALLHHQGQIRLPAASQRVEHEVELGLVMGRGSIWGHTIVVDVTARDLQRSDKTWARGKGFDTFCPTGPWVVRGLDDRALSIRGLVNGEVRQDGNTDAMIHRPEALVRYINDVMSLEPGDLVATGTPAGVGPLNEGDELIAQIEGIGELRVDVAGQR